MRGSGDRFGVGERIAFYRRRRGLTQRVLAGLVGRSEDWVSKVELHRLSVALDLGDVDSVVQAPGIDTDHMPRERAVAHQIDLARAQSLVAGDDEALQLLLSAEHTAPQLIRHSTVVRETVRSLHRRSPANGTGSSLLFGLAERCRAV